MQGGCGASGLRACADAERRDATSSRSAGTVSRHHVFREDR
jgi:hypothetical protein